MGYCVFVVRAYQSLHSDKQESTSHFLFYGNRTFGVGGQEKLITMKRLLLRIICFLKERKSEEPSKDAKISFIGSWRLISLVDSQGEKHHPHWKEVWSFAAMDESETNGIYACDYINLHTIIGKWVLDSGRLRLVRNEHEKEYTIVELSDKNLTLKTTVCNDKEMLIFQKVV